MIQLKEEFWQLSIGNLLTMASVGVSVFVAHLANVKRIENASADWKELQTKVEIMYEWFKSNLTICQFKPNEDSNYGNRSNRD